MTDCSECGGVGCFCCGGDPKPASRWLIIVEAVEPFAVGALVGFVSFVPWLAWWLLITARTITEALTMLGCLVEFTLIFAWCAGWFPLPWRFDPKGDCDGR